eukprot:scaffold2213_cov444-Prasinococcus_capsulatus_cf.AAC.8
MAEAAALAASSLFCSVRWLLTSDSLIDLRKSRSSAAPCSCSPSASAAARPRPAAAAPQQATIPSPGERAPRLLPRARAGRTSAAELLAHPLELAARLLGARLGLLLRLARLRQQPLEVGALRVQLRPSPSAAAHPPPPRSAAAAAAAAATSHMQPFSQSPHPRFLHAALRCWGHGGAHLALHQRLVKLQLARVHGAAVAAGGAPRVVVRRGHLHELALLARLDEPVHVVVALSRAAPRRAAPYDDGDHRGNSSVSFAGASDAARAGARRRAACLGPEDAPRSPRRAWSPAPARSSAACRASAPPRAVRCIVRSPRARR